MKDSSQYTHEKKHPFKRIGFLMAVCLLLLFFLPARSLAGGEPDPVPNYDEILVFMNVQGVGNIQIPAAIRNESAYLSVTDVFNFLKIRNVFSPGLDTISGFINGPGDVFLIDKMHNRIEYQGKKIDLVPDG